MAREMFETAYELLSLLEFPWSYLTSGKILTLLLFDLPSHLNKRIICQVGFLIPGSEKVSYQVVCATFCWRNSCHFRKGKLAVLFALVLSLSQTGEISFEIT